MALVKKTVPVAVYRKGLRYVVGEAMVEIDTTLYDGVNLNEVEINITQPVLTKIQKGIGEGNGPYREQG
jgi:hypothetical protein